VLCLSGMITLTSPLLLHLTTLLPSLAWSKQIQIRLPPLLSFTLITKPVIEFSMLVRADGATAKRGIR